MEIDLKAYGSMIVKRFWIILVFLVVFCYGASYYSNKDYIPLYQASTKILISEAAKLDQYSADQMGFYGYGVDTMLINTYKEIIKTPVISEKVVQRHPDLELTPEQLVSKINVVSVNDTQMMAITAVDPSQERAARIANYVTEVFQTEIPKIMKIDNIAVLNKAKVEDYPRAINQKSSGYLKLAAIAAIIVGIGVIIVLDTLDETTRSAEEVGSLIGAERIGTITRSQRGRLNRYLGYFTRSGKPQMVMITRPDSTVSEMYRDLRFNIDCLMENQSFRTLAVTSPKHGDGTTSIVINLGSAFARAGKKVLLVDANLRSPSIHKTFRTSGKGGFAELLVKGSDLDGAVSATDVPGLSVMIAGPSPMNPSDLLSSEKLEQLLASLKSHFDLILLDTPAMEKVTDAKIVASHSDGLLLVVDNKTLKRAEAKRIKHELSHSKTQLIGFVMNRATSREA